jgi:hypothetical protein
MSALRSLEKHQRFRDDGHLEVSRSLRVTALVRAGWMDLLLGAVKYSREFRELC